MNTHSELELEQHSRERLRITAMPTGENIDLNIADKKEYALGNDGVLIQTTEPLFIDRYGNSMRLDARSVKRFPSSCQKCGARTQDAFRCHRCRMRFCVSHRPITIIRGKKSMQKSTPGGGSMQWEVDIKETYCRRCYFLKELPPRMFMKLLKGIVFLFCLPFLALRMSAGHSLTASLKSIIIVFCMFMHSVVGLSQTFEDSNVFRHRNLTHRSGHMNDYGISKRAEQAIRKAETLGVDQSEGRGRRLCKRIERAIERNNPINKDDVCRLETILSREARAQKENKEEYIQFFRPHPTAEEHGISKGHIHPWQTLNGENVAVTKSGEDQGFRIAGKPGSSKTTCIFNLVSEYVRTGISCIIIDSKSEGDFDSLVRLHPGRVLVAKIGVHSFFNPWKWWRKLRVYFLDIFSRKDSGSVLDQAFDLLNGTTPTIDTIISSVANVQAKKGFVGHLNRLKQSLQTQLLKIRRSDLYPSIQTAEGWPLDIIIKEGISILIDTSSIAGSDLEEFLVASLFLAVREIKKEHKLSEKVVIAVDEGSTICNKRFEKARTLPSIVHLAGTLARGSHLITIFGYHSPSSVSEFLHSAFYMVSSALVNEKDIWSIRNAYFLTRDQASVLPDLPPGTALLRMGGGSYTKPFLIKYDKIPDLGRLSETEIDSNNKRIFETLCIEYSKPVLIRTRDIVKIGKPSAPPIQPDTSLIVLNHVFTHPCLNISERRKILSTEVPDIKNHRYFKNLLSQLVKRKLLDALEMKTKSGQGANSQIVYLTEDGLRHIGKVLTGKRPGESNATWVFKMFVFQSLGNQCSDAKFECPSPAESSKKVDIGIPSHDIAVEVCHSTFVSEPDQCYRDLEAGWGSVICIAAIGKGLKRLENEFVTQRGLVDRRITLCLPAHIRENSIKEIAGSTDLVFKNSK